MSIIFLTYAHLKFITANILLFFQIKFPRTTIGKVRKEIYDYKQEWISRGQPEDSITIKYL